MGMRAEIQSDISDAFDEDLSDAVKDITITEVKESYNIDTGVNTQIETEYKTRGVPYDIKETEIFNESVKPGDVSLIILQNEIEIQPEIDFYATFNGNKYKIMGVSKDPADVSWELLCRK